MAIQVYDTIFDCIDSKTTIIEQIAVIDEAIKNLRAAMRDFASKSNIEEYQLNDGQTIIRTKYRSLKEMADTIYVLKRDKQELLQSPNGVGRQWTNRDRDSFKRGGGYGTTWVG